MRTTMTESAGKTSAVSGPAQQTKVRLYGSIRSLADWLERNDYRAYDTFDGLNAKFVRPFTFENKLLRTVLQQGVRRFPINLRPVLGIAKNYSSKGMGFIARGCIRLHQATGEAEWQKKAEYALQWLMDNPAKGYRGMSWGNHFDYQSRSSYVPAGIPSIVWTALIGHVFLDAYDHFKKPRYLEVAAGACDHILHDLGRFTEGEACCISYFPILDHQVHNANTLGASLLGRTYSYTRNEEYKALAEKGILYTASHQRSDASWWYGEASNLRWVDNFHTGYVLDSFKYYTQSTGDLQFQDAMMKGYHYWKNTFFLADGTPKYYNHKVLPLDIQCSSQAIDTLVFFSDRDPEALELAIKVADWTIRNMQDRSGYFYYRRYSRWLVNKTPTLHWGQSTMLSALAGLYKAL